MKIKFTMSGAEVKTEIEYRPLYGCLIADVRRGKEGPLDGTHWTEIIYSNKTGWANYFAPTGGTLVIEAA